MSILSLKTRSPRKAHKIFGRPQKLLSNQTSAHGRCQLLEYIRVVVRGSHGNRPLASKVRFDVGFLDAICTIGETVPRRPLSGSVGSSEIASQWTSKRL